MPGSLRKEQQPQQKLLKWFKVITLFNLIPVMVIHAGIFFIILVSELMVISILLNAINKIFR